MPILKIVNGGTSNVVIGDTTGYGFSASVAPSSTKYLNVSSLQIETMAKKLEALRKAGNITYFVVSDAVGVAGGLTAAAAETAPDIIEGITPGGVVTFHFALTSGGAAGTADVVSLFAVNTLPFKMRIIDAYAHVSTANPGAAGNNIIRTVSDGGAGNVIVGTSTGWDTAGRKAFALEGTVTVVVTPGAAQGLFLARADRDMVGDLVVVALPVSA